MEEAISNLGSVLLEQFVKAKEVTANKAKRYFVMLSRDQK